MQHGIETAEIGRQRLDDIAIAELKARLVAKMCNVPLLSRLKIIEAHHAVPFAKQAVAHVGTNEAGSAGNQNTQIAMLA